MRKKLLDVAALLLISSASYGQVGINNSNPHSTFEITAKTTGSQTEGILIPRLPGDQIKSMDPLLSANQNSMLVYATNGATTPTGITSNLTAPGFYYYDHSLTKWVAINNGGTSSKVPISGLLDGISINSIDSKNFAQNWDWSTASTQTPLTLRANSLTTGTLLEIATANTALNSTNGLVRIINNAAPSNTTGIFTRLQPNNGSNSGISLLNNGNTGFGIILPTAKVNVVESGTVNQPAIIVSQSSNAVATGSTSSTGSKGIYIDMGAASLDRALTINQNGTGADSRGLSMTMNASNASMAEFINHNGTGEGIRIQNNNTASTSSGMLLIHSGNSTGTGIQIQMEGTANTGDGIRILESGPANSIFTTSSSGSTDPVTSVSTTRAGIWADRTIGSAAGNNAGTGYSGPASASNLLAHTSLYGSMGNATTTPATDSFMFGVIGEVLSSGGSAAVDRSGGVLGNGQVAGTFGVLGYKTSGSTNVGVYGNAAMSTGTGKTNTIANGFGVMGVGDLMGGAFRGDVYGLNVSGNRYGMYIDGATYTNNLIANVSKSNDTAEKITTFVPTSTTVDISTRGIATLDANGEQNVIFDKNFSALVAENSIVVTVTPIGNSSQMYLEKEPTSSGFTVKTDKAFAGKFSYIAIGTRKGFENVSVPKEIIASNYDEKMSEILHNEANLSTEGTPVNWNGTDLKFESAKDININTKANIVKKSSKQVE